VKLTHTPTLFLALAAAWLAAGCDSGPKQSAFPELNPVKGVVKRSGLPVKGGAVKFTPDPDNPEFLINSEVGPDGTFTLSTVRTTDQQGERKPGAAAGKYRVTYTPPIDDQTTGGLMTPITLPNPVTVNAGGNDITLDLPRK
jgi:hypothetical protein